MLKGNMLQQQLLEKGLINESQAKLADRERRMANRHLWEKLRARKAARESLAEKLQAASQAGKKTETLQFSEEMRDLTTKIKKLERKLGIFTPQSRRKP